MARSYDIAILSQKVEQIEGSIKANDVVANPEGEATADLSKVQIDGTIYGVSVVDANPTGTASTLLKKIGIDGTNYNVPHTAANIDYETGSVKTALDKMVEELTLTAGEKISNVDNIKAVIINDSILVINGYISLTENVTTGTTLFTLSKSLTNTRYGLTYEVARDKTRIIKIVNADVQSNIDIQSGNLWFSIAIAI